MSNVFSKYSARDCKETAISFLTVFFAAGKDRSNQAWIAFPDERIDFLTSTIMIKIQHEI